MNYILIVSKTKNNKRRFAHNTSKIHKITGFLIQSEILTPFI